MYFNNKRSNNNSVVDFKRSDKMNFKRKLLYFLVSFIFIIPINIFAYPKYLIPGGETIGIKVESDGVFVVGFYKVNGIEIASKAGFRIGDRIVKVNNKTIHNVEDLINNIESNNNEIIIKFDIVRDNDSKSLTMTLNKEEDSSYKTGLYVKDSIIGIGTLSYIDPDNNTFGALGHEITDNTNGFNFTILNGNIFSSKITSITKSSNNKPGEKNATINTKDIYGDISYNLETGIFGKLSKKISDDKSIEVMNINDVKVGKAEIITVLSNNKKDYYDIEILSIDKSNTTKNFLIKVVDERLLHETGGIVKGMSGSPIIQDGKLVGVITHTIVDNPKKGFGISIEKMLESVK